jgi:hypothetical protein
MIAGYLMELNFSTFVSWFIVNVIYYVRTIFILNLTLIKSHGCTAPSIEKYGAGSTVFLVNIANVIDTRGRNCLP